MSLQFTSLEQLNKESLNFQYNEQLSMTFYFKLCEQLLNKTVAIFDYQKWKLKIKNNEKLSLELINDNGMEWSFILQMRYLDLMNNRLPNHTQFLLPTNDVKGSSLRQEFIKKLQTEVPFVIENVEWLKERLKLRYNDLQCYKDKKFLDDKEYTELLHLKKHIKDENTLRKNILIQQQLNNLQDEFPINIELSREKQIEKDKFLQNIKRKASEQELNKLTIQSKKIKYGIEDLVSSLSSTNKVINSSQNNSKITSGYKLPVLTPSNSNENLNSLVTCNSKNKFSDNLIKYSLPNL
ncbi:hypothetical protein QEN19_000393 [Hanseniaspora menglaensis]